MNCPFIKKKFNFLVRPGVFDTFTRLFLPRRQFIIDDLPTLDLPANATSGSLERGYCSGDSAPTRKSAVCILMRNDARRYGYPAALNFLRGQAQDGPHL
jgi:murein endopeptidase